MTSDIRYALRSLRKHPGFTAIAVVTLALGIAGSTAMFGLVNGIVLAPLSYPGAVRLVAIWQAHPANGTTEAPVSLPDLRDWQQQVSTTVEGIAAFPSFTSFQGLVLLGEGEPIELSTGYVTTNFFDVLGVPALRGRTFSAAEGERGADRVVVLSEALWQARLGGDPSIVGRAVTLDGAPFTVVGVAPARIRLPTPEVQVWAPLSVIDSTRIPHHIRDVRWLATIARSRPAMSLERVRGELGTIARRLEAAYPDDNAGWNDVTVVPLRRDIVGDARSALLILLGAVGLLLMIGCANVAHLLLTRGAARRREIAVRTAMGASRGRIVRQLLTESVVLGLAGGAIGLALAGWALDVIVHLAGPRLPRVAEVAMDVQIAGFAVALAVATSLLFGLVPALTASSTGPMAALRDGVRGGGRSPRTLRHALVASEFAIALCLLGGAGLLANSLWRLTRVDPGFATEAVLAVEFVLPTSSYPSGEQYRAAYDAMLERVRQVPGVAAVGAAQVVPGAGNDESVAFEVPGVAPPEGEDEHEALWRAVSPGYFQTLGVPVLRGRGFETVDRGASAPVAIVSRSLASRLWPRDDAVGKRIAYDGESMEIVGVAGDVRYAGLRGAPEPVVYRPQAQHSRRRVALLVRSVAPPEALARAVTAAIHAVDPGQPIRRIRPMEDVLAGSLAESRFVGTVLAVFAVLALTLAAIGLYGAIAYAVTQRRREIGIRAALGAGRTQILAMVVGEGLRVTTAGVALGLGLGLAGSRVLESRLFGIGAADPLTFAAVASLLATVGLVACYLPARGATRIDPMEALRSE